MIDTLALAREMFPGKRNSLDALCERFGVDNAHRTLHGALLDAQLLADVYLAMTRGQESLTIDIAGAVASAMLTAPTGWRSWGTRACECRSKSLLPSADEMAAHRAYLAALHEESRGRCVWLSLDAPAESPRALIGDSRFRGIERSFQL